MGVAFIPTLQKQAALLWAEAFLGAELLCKSTDRTSGILKVATHQGCYPLFQLTDQTCCLPNLIHRSPPFPVWSFYLSRANCSWISTVIVAGSKFNSFSTRYPLFTRRTQGKIDTRMEMRDISYSVLLNPPHHVWSSLSVCSSLFLLFHTWIFILLWSKNKFISLTPP